MAKDRIIAFAKQIMGNYFEKTAFSSAASLLAGAAFLVYNGFLGVVYGAAWNISIFIYYTTLSAVKIYVLICTRKTVKKPQNNTASYKKKVFVSTHAVLAFLDFSLIAPIMEMALGHRNYTFGLIPAIAMAAYTTYRLTASIIHFRKSRKTNNIFVLELRTINIIDSLVAVLTLQNAMIIANGGFDDGLRKLAVYTSVGILLVIMAITVASYFKGKMFCQIEEN